MKLHKKLKPEGYFLNAVVDIGGKKERQRLNQPVLTAGTTSIVTLLSPSFDKKSDVGTAPINKEKPPKSSSPESDAATKQQKLIDFVSDPAVLRKAAEGSMEKRRKKMYGN